MKTEQGLNLTKAIFQSLLLVLLAFKSFAATPPNTVIDNIASAFTGSPAVLAAQSKTSFVLDSDFPAEIDGAETRTAL